jgi:hypothetical protein
MKRLFVVSSSLLLLVFAQGAVGQKPIPHATMKGYFKTKKLAGGLGTKGGSITPKRPGDTFLGVVMSVPQQVLIPTEAEYEQMKMKKNEPRETIKAYTPRHYQLILPDSRSFNGIVITLWSGVESIGFATGMRAKGAIPWKLEEIGVAFIVSESEATPPFRVQIRRQKPILVPDNQIAAPPEKVKYPWSN